MITKQGKLKLEQKLADLELELIRTVEERSKAAAEGDLRENSAYLFLGERAEVLRTQIAELKEDLKNITQIISMPNHTVHVVPGHKVTLKYEDGRILVLVLVGKHDSGLKPGWFSVESPMGQAILGKKVGDKATFNDQNVSILAIEIENLE